MSKWFRQMFQDESGQDLIEYALIAGFISVVCYIAIQATGTSISDVWATVSDAAAAA